MVEKLLDYWYLDYWWLGSSWIIGTRKLLELLVVEKLLDYWHLRGSCIIGARGALVLSVPVRNGICWLTLTSAHHPGIASQIIGLALIQGIEVDLLGDSNMNTVIFWCAGRRVWHWLHRAYQHE